eukprot:CAMPEP_0119298808 /NCGR_PEP_ID=MMETSP1333-20130426/946_1 /TAXON_ID=418940 /ORGANISM="Scyphosphaera apsteinii, Strain RCC1455" /LENGTH=363 /DNA_ID=CAMNT_0007300009 /DNA_START=15 /DNA_END=1109 /DNA_ORIENTATION=+
MMLLQFLLVFTIASSIDNTTEADAVTNVTSAKAKSKARMRDKRFWHAAFHGNTSGVKEFLDMGHGVDELNRQGATALMLAARNGSVATMELLLDYGANLAYEGGGWNSLMLAAVMGNVDAVRFLIERGADANGADSEGGTVLMLAVHKGKEKVVRELVAAGANVIAKMQGDGLTALHFAVQSGRAHVLPALLASKSANVEIRDNNGTTPLMMASYAGEAEAVKILLEHGADYLAINPDGYNAITMSGGEIAVLDELEKVGAQLPQDWQETLETAREQRREKEDEEEEEASKMRGKGGKFEFGMSEKTKENIRKAVEKHKQNPRTPVSMAVKEDVPIQESAAKDKSGSGLEDKNTDQEKAKDEL